MAVVCSRCSHLYETAGNCPRCDAAPRAAPDAPAPRLGPRWQQTTRGRVLIGLVVAQGLFYGLRHFLTGVLMAASGVETAQELWQDMRNLLALQGLQVFGALCGGVLASGGQRNGFVLGAVVGACNGVLSLILRQGPSQALNAVELCGQPLLQAAFAALGGWVGSLIWRPIPAEAVPIALGPPRKRPAPPRGPSPFAGKIAWFRVVTGGALAVAGTLSAQLIFLRAMDASGGKLGTTSVLQDQLITWELRALAVLAGGALAGATTPNGLKQGLAVGITATAVLLGVQAPKVTDFFQFSIVTTLSTMCLSLAGGWFGGQLFPQVLRRDRRFGPSW
jgi:hypothetical protein